MHLHALLHVAFEDLTGIETWASQRGWTISRTLLFDGQPLPPVESIDALVVLGGPMNIYEEDAYPWLAREKAFIAQAIERGCMTVGVCLGAQLIADVLGGPVTRNAHKEIGWFPVTWTPQGTASPLAAGLPNELTACHWHGDTFAIPPGAVHLAASAACHAQAFLYGHHVLGLQFHFEYSTASVEAMLAHCGDELAAAQGPYIQTPGQLREGAARHAAAAQAHLARLLDNLAAMHAHARRCDHD